MSTKMFKPGFTESNEWYGPKVHCYAAGTISAYDIVIVTAASSNVMTCVAADSDAAATARGWMGVALHAATSGQEMTVAQWALYRNVDTSAYAANGSVWLSGTAGGRSTTPGTIPVRIGTCTVSNATTGIFLLDPNACYGSEGATWLPGTNYLTWTVNLDAAAATDEDPALILLGGDGTAAPTDDIVRITLQQESDGEILQIRTERSRNAGAFADVDSALHVGISGNTDDVNSSLVLNSGDGTLAVASTLALDPTANTLTLASSADRTAAAATVATPAIRIDTGDRTTNDAAVGNGSGGITVQTGATDCTNAGGTAGPTGALLLASGDAASTAGTSGASGAVTLESGDSADGNSGLVTVQSGAPAAAGTSGNVAIATGATTGAGTSGNISLTTGTTVGGTRGDVVITCDQVNLRPVTDVNLLNDIPVRFGTSANLQFTIDYDSASTTFMIDGVEPAADLPSANCQIETGAVSSTTGARVSGNLVLRSGATTANGNNGGVSGAWVGGTGVSDVTSANTGGNSGPVTLASGATDCNDAGGTGGASGNVTVQSGDCAATAGTGGASGSVTVESGTSVSGATGGATLQSGASTNANTGTVTVQSGNGSTASGGVDVLTGTTGGGNTGTIRLSTGAATGGNSGDITFSTGTATGNKGTVQSLARMTTTDGVAAGTARIVGGKAYGIVADSSLVDPVGIGDGVETALATYTIPASTITSGTKIRVDFAYVVTVGGTVETLVMRLRLGGVGGTVIASSTSLDPAANDVGSGYAVLVGRAAPGAAASVAHYGVIKGLAGVGVDSAMVQQGPTLTNFATNGALDLVLTADFAAAEGAGGDTIVARIFDVDVIG